MGKVERKLPKSRLNGEDAWFMMFVSTREKMSHHTRPSIRPERRARLIVIVLSLWNAPKISPNTPPSTISKKKPAKRLIVGLAMVMPNQCNASGNVRPGVPSVTKLSIAQATSCWNGSQSQAQQHKHAVYPVPIYVGKPYIQLSSKNDTEDCPKASEDSEHQRNSYNQFSGPDTRC